MVISSPLLLIFPEINHCPRILSLDGGGIRGLSSLLILKEIMEEVRRQTKAEETPRPCEYFDLMGGTSTGGLIVIMLGRLGMVMPPHITRTLIYDSPSNTALMHTQTSLKRSSKSIRSH